MEGNEPCKEQILFCTGSNLEDHLAFIFMAKLQAIIRQEDRQLMIIWALNIVQIFIQLKIIWMVSIKISTTPSIIT